MKESLLLIDKSPIRYLENFFIKNSFVVYKANTQEEAIDLISLNNISAIVYKALEDTIDFELIDVLTKKFPLIQIIVISITNNIQKVLNSIRYGAFDFVKEPFDKEELIHIIKKAIAEKRELEVKISTDRRNKEYVRVLQKELDATKQELDSLKREVMAKNLELEMKHGIKGFSFHFKKPEMNKDFRIGKYTLLDEIGHGGMSTVYKAIDPVLKRVVAIKELTIIYKSLPTEIIEDVVKRFKKEAQVIAKLNHDNIVKVFDVVEDKSYQYMVMEYIEGFTLDKITQAGRKLPILEAINIVSEICLALEYIHEHDIIHRDIKPSNIILCADRSVKLMDFGVIRDKSISTLTPTGSIVGTVSYTAPEQSSKKIDNRVDIFSLGTVLYELLTGVNPYESKTYADTFLKVTTLKPDPPSKHNYECNEDLDKVVLKAMEKNPNKRYATAKEFSDRLQQFIEKYISAF